MAFSDYAAGQWPLAIQGFETYMRAFPRSEQSDDAQFYIGEAYQLDGKMREALAAYERVGRLPAEQPRRRLVLQARARLQHAEPARQGAEMFETTIEIFPNSESSRLAKQLLDV